jgi:hypothetical protein
MDARVKPAHDDGKKKPAVSGGLFAAMFRLR